MSISAIMQPQRPTSEHDLSQMFLDRAIHDLRASARQIGTSAELLSEILHGKLGQDAEPGLRRLGDGVAGMNRILIGMSSYAVALSAASYTFRRVSLNSAVDSAVARLGEPISLTGAVVTRNDLPEVSGDADRLSEVFQHLIGNALTYRSKESPRIVVQGERETDGWLIAIRDNGIGFEQKYQDHVFAPFYRLHGPEIPGVGLGLAICRQILVKHQSEIWIESEKGSGATCFFTLRPQDGERMVEC